MASRTEKTPAQRREDVQVPSSLLLDDQLCFALYAASRSMTAAYRPLLDELGLTYPQYLVMLVLWERGPSKVKDVSVALRLDYGTLTPLLKRLETLGFVDRQRSVDDERTVEVVLTEEGSALRERATTLPPQVWRAVDLTAAEVDRLRDLLRTLTDNVSRHLSGAGDR